MLSERVEYPFSEDLEERLNSVTNIVNSEIKIATLLHLGDTLAKGGDILAKIRNTVGPKVKLTIGKNFSGYCHQSLLPAGMVAEEEIMGEFGKMSHIGYRTTEAGKKYGVPIAAFSLQWGVDHDTSLYSIFGRTGFQNKPGSPLNRIKILKLLKKNGNLRRKDLIKHVNIEGENIRGNLTTLQEKGFVKYSSVPEPCDRKGIFEYKYLEKKGEPKTVGTQKILTRKVLESMRELRIANSHQIANKLVYQYPTTISSILSDLVKQDFLQKHGEFTKKRQSNAQITDSGKRFIDEYVTIVEEALCEDTYLKVLQKDSERFLADTKKVRAYLIKGIENYWSVSPMGNAKSREETNLRVIEYLKQNPGARSRDLKKDLDIHTSSSTYLLPLVKANILKRRQTDDNNKLAIGYFVK